MYANTAYNHVYYEALYTQYRSVHQTKMSTSMHCIPNLPNLLFAKFIVCQIYHVYIYGIKNVNCEDVILKIWRWKLCTIVWIVMQNKV